MTNNQAKLLLNNIGKISYQNKVKIKEYDRWFMYNMSLKIESAHLLTAQQQNYLLIIYHTIKKNKYRSDDGKRKF